MSIRRNITRYLALPPFKATLIALLIFYCLVALITLTARFFHGHITSEELKNFGKTLVIASPLCFLRMYLDLKIREREMKNTKWISDRMDKIEDKLRAVEDKGSELKTKKDIKNRAQKAKSIKRDFRDCVDNVRSVMGWEDFQPPRVIMTAGDTEKGIAARQTGHQLVERIGALLDLRKVALDSFSAAIARMDELESKMRRDATASIQTEYQNLEADIRGFWRRGWQKIIGKQGIYLSVDEEIEVMARLRHDFPREKW